MFSRLIVQRINNPAIGNLGSLNGIQFFGNLVPALVSFAFVAGALIFLFILVLGGIQWITAGGDKASLEAARSKLANALIGIIILFSFFAIVNLVECFFGIGLKQITIGPYNISFTGSLTCSGGGSPGPLPTPTPNPLSCPIQCGANSDCVPCGPGWVCSSLSRTCQPPTL